MSTQTEVPDQTLEDLATYFSGKYKYIGLATGTDPIATTATDITDSVPIGTLPDDYNKIEDTSIISSRTIIKTFEILSGEPVTQSVNIGQVGLMSTATNSSSLGVGAKLNVAQTKDNTVKQKWRLTAKMKRVGE